MHVTYTPGQTFLNREIDKFTVKKFKVQTPHHDNNACVILFKLILYHFSWLILFRPSGLLSVAPIGLPYLWASANAVPSSWDTLPHTSCLAHSSYPSVLDFITVLSERCSLITIYESRFPCYSLSLHAVHLSETNYIFICLLGCLMPICHIGINILIILGWCSL